METKICKKCGRELPLDAFALGRARNDGHQAYCKECSSKISAEYHRKKRLELEALVRKVTPVKEKPKKEEPIEAVTINVTPINLHDFSTSELSEELKGRGISVLINPTPRDLMSALKKAGYSGTLEYYEKRTVNLNSAF